MATNIPVAVKHCLDQFKGLEAVNDSETLGSDEYDIKNELDRFKVWVGNLAAHRPMGKRSLEYRLRDAEDLRSSVLDLLSDLSSALHRCELHAVHTRYIRRAECRWTRLRAVRGLRRAMLTQ